MKDYQPLRMNLQFFAEGEGDPNGGGEDSKIKLGDAEFTPEELLEKLKSYDKLEKQFTKVSQENSELKKSAEPVQKWLEFDRFISQYPPDVQQKFIENVNTFFSAVQTGNVTQKDITGLDKAIGAAKKEGDTKTADQLEDWRDEALTQLTLDKEIVSVGKQAKKDGIDFDEDEFRQFIVKTLEEDGDEEFDTDDIPKYYRLYKADKKLEAAEKQQKGELPKVGTGGTGASASPKNNSKAPKSIKEATEMARNWNWG